MDIDVEKDYYAMLGVSPLATSREIKHAYHELARRYHPDTREVETSTRLFHGIQEAYSVLVNDSSRRSYDRQREERERSDDTALGWDILVSREILSSEHEEQVLYALVEVRPAIAPVDKRLPLELSIVIDRSTSMKGARLESVKEAARQIIDDLHDDDYLSLIAFDDRAELVLSGHVGPSRARAKMAVRGLDAQGGTELLKGVRVGLGQLGKYRGQDVVSHLILLTDGRTYGDEEACLEAATRAGDKDIGITAMGIGEDWNDDLLDEMAARSGGTSAYISSPGQVRTLLASRIHALGSVFATELMLSVRTAPGVCVESVFQTAPSLDRLHLSDGVTRLGPLEIDKPRRMLVEVAVERRPPGEHRLLQLDLYGDVPSLGRRGERLRRGIWCEFIPTELGQSERDVPAAVLEALSRIALYRMQEQAWTALEEGRAGQASRQLERMATRLLDLGEKRLAEAALLEAESIIRTGRSTEDGRKRIKYGTRTLNLERDL